MPIILTSIIQAWKDMHGVDVISVNVLLWSLFLIAFQDPWRNFRLLRHAPEAVKDRSRKADAARASQYVEEAYPSMLWKRLAWVGRLLTAIRLDYWKISMYSHDRQQPPAPGFSSRKQFLQHSLLSLTRAMIVLDLTRVYINHDPYFFDPRVSMQSDLPFRFLYCIPPQLVRSMVVGAQAWALIGQLFYLPAAIPVILNMVRLIPDSLSPHTWPAYFGSPKAIFMNGVRGFWGHFWHQTMRWSTTGPGYALSDLLGLKQGLLRYAILSTSAFMFSGIVHMGLVPPEPSNATRDVNEIRLHMAGFFWAQAVAVIIEAVVARIIGALDAKRWDQGWRLYARMFANGIWTIVWFALSIPLLAEAARQMGYWRVWPFPISVWNGLNGRGWIVWPFLLP